MGQVDIFMLLLPPLILLIILIMILKRTGNIAKDVREMKAMIETIPYEEETEEEYVYEEEPEEEEYEEEEEEEVKEEIYEEEPDVETEETIPPETEEDYEEETHEDILEQYDNFDIKLTSILHGSEESASLLKNLGMSEEKAAKTVENLPVVVKRNVSRDKAKKLYERLKTEFEIELTPLM